MLDLSIIIVNWNGKDLVRRCIEAVRATTERIRYEVIVVDNNSSDGSQEFIRSAFPDVTLIENTDNAGFAHANNQGMAVATGRYLLLLNSDAFVNPGTLDAMVAFMDAHPEAGMSACKLLYEDGRLQPSAYAFPSLRTELYTAFQLDKLFARSREFGQYLMTWWDFDDVRPVDSVMGAFMLARREAVEAVGPMDESYFMYSEEVDWCFRFRRAGWQILYNPAVTTVHLWGGSSGGVRLEMFLQLYRSKVLFFRKNYGPLHAQLLKLILGLGCLLRIGPGLIYYRFTGDSSKRDKHQAFRALWGALPAF